MTKAFVFSIGERTTDLCCELMQRYGFEVVLYQDDTTLWDKLKRFYTEALETEDTKFVRIDADVIPNRNVLKLVKDMDDYQWVCASGYDWYRQDRGAVSIHVMTRAIVYGCLWYIESAKDKVRPETHLWRNLEINPFTHVKDSYSCGIHGYGQQDQRERIKKLKQSRDQAYDWSLVERIEAL